MTIFPVIDRFDGTEHAFLSNFYPFGFEWLDVEWSTSEHAYQAAKMTDLKDFKLIWQASSPAIAKKLGRVLPIRKDWDQVKDSYMKEILLAKFRYPSMRMKLLATGDAELIEGNTWGDMYWGQVAGTGLNKLGKLLMEVREILCNEKYY